MRKNLTRIALAVAALVLVTAFTACTAFQAADIEIAGTWQADNSALGAENTVITVTNTSIVIDNPAAWAWDYKGEVVRYSNWSYNIGTENPDSGNFGYLVFKITEHENAFGQAQVGKYSVIRWKDLTDSSVSYSESAVSFDTLEEADAQANAEEHFALFSELTK